jgi:hypothetical protein
MKIAWSRTLSTSARSRCSRSGARGRARDAALESTFWGLSRALRHDLAREHERERRVDAAVAAGGDLTAVRLDDLAGDVEAQAQPARAGQAARPPRQRLEQAREQVRRDRAAVAHLDAHVLGRRAVQQDVEAALGLAMFERVRHQVGEHLRQAICVPAAAAIAALVQAQGPRRVRLVQLVHDLPDEGRQVERLPVERHARPHAHAREVQQLIDHARHALAAAQDALERPGQALLGIARRRDARRGDDGGQRVAQVVPQDAREQLVEAHGLAQLADGLEARHGGGDVVGDGAGQVQLAGRQLVGNLVVDDQLAHQAPGRHQRDERQRAPRAVGEGRRLAGQADVGGHVRHQHGHGVARLARPGRPALQGGRPGARSATRGDGPRPAVGVEDHDRRVIGRQRVADGVEGGLVDLVDARRPQHRARQPVQQRGARRLFLREGAARLLGLQQAQALEGLPRVTDDQRQHRPLVGVPPRVVEIEGEGHGADDLPLGDDGQARDAEVAARDHVGGHPGVPLDHLVLRPEPDGRTAAHGVRDGDLRPVGQRHLRVAPGGRLVVAAGAGQVRRDATVADQPQGGAGGAQRLADLIDQGVEHLVARHGVGDRGGDAQQPVHLLGQRAGADRRARFVRRTLGPHGCPPKHGYVPVQGPSPGACW